MTRKFDGQLALLVVINMAVMMAAWMLVGEKFMSPFNLQSMAGQIPELALLAMGVSLAMIAGDGGIDLSGIALANLSAITAFLVIGPIAEAGMDETAYVLAFAAVAVVTGCVGGLFNGVLIGYAGIPAIIATLGTQLVFTGVAVGMTGGSAMTLGYIPVFDDLGNTPVWGLPLTVWGLLVVVVLLAALLRFTKFGVLVFMMGSSRTAAHFAGVPIRSILLRVYMLAGLFAGLAGVVIAARTSSMKWDYGTSYVLVAILIAVMAGVRPNGGHGRIVCVLLSAVALQLMSSLFNFMALSNFFRDFAWGALLLTFLALSNFDPRAWMGSLGGPSREKRALSNSTE